MIPEDASSGTESAPIERFTTRDLARLAGLRPSQVRRCVYAGFLQPIRGLRQRYEYDFRDLLLLRATRNLFKEGLGPQRISELLEELRDKLDDDRQISSFRLSMEDGELTVSDGRARWHPSSGQMLLPLDAARTASTAVRSLDRDRDDQAAYRAFSRGLALEEVSPEDAMDAYRTALDLDPRAVPAHINLGRLQHQAGNHRQAEELYQAALRLDPEEPTAAFNLAVLAEDEDDPRTAIQRYEALLAFAPRTADAHHRLARLYGQLGKADESRHHMRRYRTLLKRR